MKIKFVATLALAILCVSSLKSSGQSGQITGIAHIAYRASDLNKEIAFLQKLGYQESFGFTGPAGKTTEVFVKVNDHQFIEVYPRTDPSQPLGWMHVCYESGDLNALYSALTARGLKPAEVRKAGAGNLISSLNDPEGCISASTGSQMRCSASCSLFPILRPQESSTSLVWDSKLAMEGKACA